MGIARFLRCRAVGCWSGFSLTRRTSRLANGGFCWSLSRRTGSFKGVRGFRFTYSCKPSRCCSCRTTCTYKRCRSSCRGGWFGRRCCRIWKGFSFRFGATFLTGVTFRWARWLSFCKWTTFFRLRTYFLWSRWLPSSSRWRSTISLRRTLASWCGFRRRAFRLNGLRSR